MTDASPDRMQFTLISALLLAPLVGVEKLLPYGTDATEECHRVEAEGLPLADWGEAKFATAVCGRKVKLLVHEWKALRTRNTPYKRCAACRTWKRAKS